MKSQINDLVTMRDIDSLFEIMTQDEDWMLQLDAAEGLIELGDKRGLEFLLAAQETEISDMNDVAQEMLEKTEIKQKCDALEAELENQHKSKVQAARGRIQKGQKVFHYKAIYLPSSSIMQEAIFSEGFDIPDLNDLGLEGWEVVNFIPRQRNPAGGAEYRFPGAYLLIKKQLSPDDSADLDEM